MPPTRLLDFNEIRVLGALLEKEQTTPDQYPLSVNALLAACNQKSNRDPVTRLSETEVVEALDRLRSDVLAWRVDGVRVERWEHTLTRRWHLTPARKAIMTLLLLRGPQTVGEIRTRSERMHAFESVADVEARLREMAAEAEPLVRELPRHPGQRESRWMHLAGRDEPAAAAEVEAAPPRLPARGSDEASSSSSPDTGGEDLVERVAGLEAAVDELRAELARLRAELGG